MDVDGIRKALLNMAHVEETVQWGDNLVFWVGDKAIGGKMFALVNLEGRSNSGQAGAVMMFAAGQERFAELVETEGVFPAPYMARIYWVALERWDVFRNAEMVDLLKAAHAMVYAKLPKKTKDALQLPAEELTALVTARRKVLAAQAAKAAADKARAKAKAAAIAAIKKAEKKTAGRAATKPAKR